MKCIKSVLELLAFLQVLFIIYGVFGSYEQGYIELAKFIEYLLLFGSALLVNVLGVKALTAANEIKNHEFFNNTDNRRERSVKLVRFDYTLTSLPYHDEKIKPILKRSEMPNNAL